MTNSLVADRHSSSLLDEATATFSPDRVYRYALTRVWNPELPLAAFIMLNPSTADAFAEDPTVRRCIGYARTWNAGGLLVLNLFALRSTDPDALYRHPDPVGPDNNVVIAEHFAAGSQPIGPVVAAWGVHGAHYGRGAHVLDLLRARGVRPLCLGVTQGGQPLHPLYQPSATIPVEYGEGTVAP